ncbi:protein-tyrosine phosphatase [Aspergillus nomiae NRRL 13137]|uniref:protein-tyrosine-phosphatase n=1 Tax=Aspergillus nomiae NRRL (strain ATCC 15546 / NRRL 13137 / CBS 260.88 / M93) TaxID=1509407 RepID=A0A0L1IMB9_ASPN3|nr:protein-tyrosine phosphatase [Aspergillus nomiae NRRL 13137]KNG80420.1 protein-tyrosine phosphatase [Aspergillus nomiae NRRL 13137]
MPVQTSPPSVPDSFPSFMSVFGGRPLSIADREEQTTGINPLDVPTNVTVNTSRRPLPFKHRESISSMTSASTDSSPTTTISTFDSPSGPETSPSSSPESPTSMPLSYTKFMPPPRNVESHSLSTAHNNLSKLSSDTPNPVRPDSPGRRARNLKNLSLRMPPPSQSSRPPIATASIVETTSQHHLSAPPSPVHIPPKSTRRKPANLTIRTPGFDRSFSSNISEVPPTPLGRQPRRPSASEDNPSPLQPVPDENSVSGSVLHELDEEDDHLDSRESTRRNERGYPNGPIQIYDSGVYLYLEPTVQEASQFDVVVNVAKEVVNPFTNTNTNNGSVMSVLRNASTNPKAVPTEVPETAMSDISFKSAFEYPPNESLPPTPRNDASKPEYIHVGWDHNSEILEDLYPLCELIDSRISQGKKVLVHCQLGASRSASLVIAYGLYKNRHLDFNSMYEIVKGRSQWVGPNMSLIYQLTDFRSRLLQGGPSKPAPEEWFAEGLRRGSEPQPSRTEAMSQPEIVTPALPASCAGLSQSSTSSLSVPSTNQTTPTSAESLSFPKTPSHKRSLSPRPLTLRKSSFQVGDSAVRSIRPESLLNSWRSESGPYSLAKTDIFMRDGPAEPPALFSPRTTGFLAAPMSQSISSQLENNGLHGFRFGSRIADPRSPPPGNERLIMRNIDEFL